MSNGNQHISLEEAIELTKRYRANRPADFFISETFDAANIRQLLNQPGCEYLRIYLGRKKDDTVVAVLVGADASEGDILPAAAAAEDDDTVILEDGYRCPEYCPHPPSALQSQP